MNIARQRFEWSANLFGPIYIALGESKPDKSIGIDFHNKIPTLVKARLVVPIIPPFRFNSYKFQYICIFSTKQYADRCLDDHIKRILEDFIYHHEEKLHATKYFNFVLEHWEEKDITILQNCKR